MTTVEPSYAGLWPRLIVLGLGAFVVGTNAYVIAGLLPAIAGGLHTTAAAASYSITYYSLVVAVASPLVATFLARVPRTALMTGGMVLFAVGSLVAVSSSDLTGFVLGRIIAGLGGAAYVPVATASAATMARPEQRGRALAVVLGGFTLATAVGSPLGTAIGHAGGWRLPLYGIVAIAIVIAVLVALTVRRVPLAPAASLRARVRPLARWSVVAPLLTTLLSIAAFNLVYIFCSFIAAPALGEQAGLLAVILLACGLGGVLGTVGSGPATDRLGARRIGVLSLAGTAVVLVALGFTSASLVAVIVLYALVGVLGFATSVPIQHRIVAVDPAASSITLGWNSTALYFGIALAPVLGSITEQWGTTAMIATGAVVMLVALLVFMSGYPRREKAPYAVSTSTSSR